MTDARFEDGDEQPLRLLAQDAESLTVLAALLQDAVFPISEMTYAKSKHRFALLLNRFRWENKSGTKRPERVQSLLVFDTVLAVKTSGIDRDSRDTVLSLLDVTFAQTEQGAGEITLILAGDGAIALSVEALDASLRDTTRPYYAPSGKTPNHD